MGILHGSWLLQGQSSCFFIWGETWRSIDSNSAEDELTKVQSHPFGMTPLELFKLLQERNLKIPNSWGIQADNSSTKSKRKPKTTATKEDIDFIDLPSSSVVIALPTHIPQEKKKKKKKDIDSIQPFHSGVVNEAVNEQYLYSWQVEGFCLNSTEAVKFLTSLPMNVASEEEDFIGGDLRFWSQIGRWGLDLISRCKFLPGIENVSDDSKIASWEALLDSAVDGSRLDKYSRLMPLSCRLYQGQTEQDNYQAINLPPESEQLLLDFLNKTVDAQVREMVNSLDGAETRLLASLPSVVKQWLHSLTTKKNSLSENTQEVERLEAALNSWTLPLQNQLGTRSLFRTCFVLRTPEEGETEWLLEYSLQAIDDEKFLLDAQTIWKHPVEKFVYQNRTIDKPQETFLRGLGLASRLYPIMAPSLDTALPQFCRLEPMQAYDFIKSVTWRFEDSGLGVILPDSLANRDGWANRLGLKVSAETPNKKTERLGLQSLLNFKWELAIGGQTLSKQQFDKLVALKSPLVQINDEWVELRPQDIKTAQTFFAGRKEKMSLSLEDALRLGSGDTQTIEKLPVVSFEASGALQELITNLTDNQDIETLSTPESFHGELRPYQRRGMSWLSFLERWGLGACLADDMGLGKCVAPDTQIYINGCLNTAENIWESYAGETQFDGEGFWSESIEKLIVNSIDESTGKIIQAPIRRLYRQQVKEKLIKINLKDGNSITITRRHKLLTNKGWTNHLEVGDYVCVPAKILREGKNEDNDLITFLAWQIAEGYEVKNRARLTITQKDTAILSELRLVIQRIGEKFGIKINNPAIEIPANHKVPYLVLNSCSYQKLLQEKGYCWGKLSADKSVPTFIMQASANSVRIFLRNYFDAEASVIDSMGSVEVSSASSLLIQQISVLLRRFGIWLRISSKLKCATNGTGIYRTYYIGTIGGNSIRRFLKEVGFGVLEKHQKLQTICNRLNNTNVEGIPASQIVAETVKRTKLPLRHFGIHSNVYINGSQQFSKESLQQVLVGMNKIINGVALKEYQQLKPSKWTSQTLEAYSNLDIEELRFTKESIQTLVDQEVFYCKIESIEDVNFEGWVYDFEVEKHHNFVANNIICHNTIQFIAFLLHLQEEEALEKPTLLVCPTSVLGNWEREVKKFAPNLKVLQYHGDKRPKGKAFQTAVKDKNIIITSYSLVHRDLKSLQDVSWQIIALDEAQNIKNAESKQSQAVRQLEPDFRIALTGTPVENRLQELWSIMDFLNPGYLGNKQFFQRRFAMPIEKYGDTSSLSQLRSLVQPFILRRLKTDRDIIQDLPEKQEMTVFCGLTPEQAKLYQKVVEDSLAAIDDAEGLQRRGMILGLLVKLKQICNHPAQYLKKKTLDNHDSAKLQRLDEMLEEAISNGDRALIFTQFAEWGKLLKPHLEEKLNRETLFLYGSTTKKQREEMIDRFQHDPQAPPVMILSLKAGGVGLNLTRANHVFHFDRWWNPAVENQATDRVFRIGQTKNVQVHKFVCTGTLEEKIHDMIESKKQLAEQVVGAGEEWLTEMDTDQLRNLLILDRDAVIEEES